MDDTGTGTTATYTYIDSPLGPLLAVAEGGALTELATPGHPRKPEEGWAQDDDGFTALREQVESYFAGRRRQFDLPIAPRGTAFQQAVWRALREIPYGETRTYGTIARRVGRPAAVRAVGLANARNPVCIVVPCHRVIGADGTLTGYAGGLEAKRLLLDLEAGSAIAAPGAQASLLAAAR